MTAWHPSSLALRGMPSPMRREGLCFCGRTLRGFAWWKRGREMVPCCSMACLNIITKRNGDMSLNVDEYEAVQAASDKVGEFLENIGKTDLAAMTREEWLDFLAHAYDCICTEARAKWDAGEVPF